ncbi:hypothetical protein, partial [Halomonas sp. ND22Bw]|uniref:hypothetical protein n=1 Tax=Halomonas sp. ND22Bw TaxID=2054178 RepID=UPI001C63ADEB
RMSCVDNWLDESSSICNLLAQALAWRKEPLHDRTDVCGPGHKLVDGNEQINGILSRNPQPFFIAAKFLAKENSGRHTSHNLHN